MTEKITLQLVPPKDSQHEIFFVDIDPNSTTLELKHQINNAIQLPPDSQKLLSVGKVLKNDSTLIAQKVKNNSKIMVLNQSAGKPQDLNPKPTKTIKPDDSSKTANLKTQPPQLNQDEEKISKDRDELLSIVLE